VWCYKDRSNILFYIAYSFFQAQLCVISKHTVNVPTMQKKLAVVLPAMLVVEFSIGLDIFSQIQLKFIPFTLICLPHSTQSQTNISTPWSESTGQYVG
jgi:hypothetical protein